MSAAKSSSVRALRPLGYAARHARPLHLTGAALSPSRTASASAPSPSQQSLRHFSETTSRPATGDGSTIDFAYLPQQALARSATSENPTDDMRVPILPDNFTPRRVGAHAPLFSDFEAAPPQDISTVAAESTHFSAPSAMADAHDYAAANIDFAQVAETLTEAAKKVTLGTERDKGVGEEIARAQGMVRQVWKGFLDDVFGSDKKPAA